ncbi:hypothetical protein Fmac_031415 [Flemingia macrophylla]|uniref:Uncharacterized protein n=1 Tax=Flemingia macrophylla TaxID=520843 RepID=A0ABD1L202_9FABA
MGSAGLSKTSLERECDTWRASGLAIDLVSKESRLASVKRLLCSDVPHVHNSSDNPSYQELGHKNLVRGDDVIGAFGRLALILSSSYLPIGFVLICPEVSCYIHTKQQTWKRNIVDQVNKISPRIQDVIKAYSDSPITEEIWGNWLDFGHQVHMQQVTLRSVFP